MMTHEEIEAAIERLMATEPSDYVGYVASVAKVVWGFMDGTVSALEFRDALIAMLEQADPDTHMKLPRDADGVPIHIGDELWGYGYPNGGVYCMAINGKGVIFVSELGSMSYKDMLLWDPKDCRHYHKPTVEDVLVDYYKECQLHASKLGLLGLATNEDDERAWREIATAFVEKLREVIADE